MSFQDIRKTRNRLSPEEIRLLFFILIGLAILLVANITLARALPGGEWLYLRWSGARVFLFGQIEPYSSTVAERVQQLVYGRIALSSEYRYVLNDPFYIVLLYIPLALFSEFALARGIWMLIAEVALVTSVIFAVRLSGWEPPRWLLILLSVFSLSGYYSLLALVSASPSIFLVFLYLATLLALRSFNDELAGALLCLAAYQWEVGGLFVIFILAAVIANKRWRVLTGFGMSLFVLLVVSFLVFSGWGLPYIRAVLSDWYGGANLNLYEYLSRIFSGSNFPVGMIVTLVSGVIVLIEWAASIRASFRRIVWTASLSLAVMPLLGMAIFPANYVVLILPLILILALIWERWHRQRVWTTLLVLGPTWLIPFGLYEASNSYIERIYPDLLTLLPPIAAIVGLYWMRWQVIRGSRPWFEQVRARP